MKILVVGKGRAGKDESCAIIERLTGLRNAGTFSKYLAPFVAAELGVSEAEAYAKRHEHRMEWFRIGNEMRAADPCRLCRLAFAAGDVSGGVRGLPEIEAIRREGLADLIVWVERDVPDDPTMEFGREYADCVIDNTGTLADLEAKWARLLQCGRTVYAVTRGAYEDCTTEAVFGSEGAATAFIGERAGLGEDERDFAVETY